jgi:hypothetical protein
VVAVSRECAVWRAAVLAALSYIIVIIVAVPDEAIGFPVVTPTSAALMPAGECAPIIDYDPNEQFVFAQVLGTSYRLVTVIVGVRKIVLPQVEGVVRGHDGYTKEFVIFINTKGSIRSAGIIRFDYGAHVLDDGWRFSVVCHLISSKGRQIGVFGVHFELARTKYKDVWPFQVGVSGFGYSSLAVGGIGVAPCGYDRYSGDAPHLFAGTPQRPSERGYSDGRESSEEAIVQIDERNERHRHFISGAVVIVGIIIFAVCLIGWKN